MIPLGMLHGTSEPLPSDSRKSFYGKCKVEKWTGGDLLRSYGTAVVFKSKSTGKLYRLWGGWSATTGRHVAGVFGLNKSEYEKLPQGKLENKGVLVGDEIPELERWPE